MEKNKDTQDSNELFMSSQMMMVVSYTIFSVILIGETLLLGWESWAIVLIVGGVGASWFMHINRIANSRTRLWIVSLLMMATYFFYGSHVTSTYDLAIIMAAVILLFIMTGMHALITLCQITYYITMTYAVILLFLLGEKFDSLVISRTLMHYAVVTMLCWIARIIIKKWNEVLGHSREEINILTAATKRLNDFLANASHEIRTPINAILGLCDMGLDKETDGEKRGRLLSIEEAGKRMGEQISDILDYSEIDRGDLTNNNEDYMLSSVINDIVNSLAPYMKKTVELIIDIDASIPSVMNTDVGKLKKIMWHLITNGLKFTNDGGVYVHISPVPHDYGINLRIEVTDTGIGMDAAELENIYSTFYMADSGRSKRAGGLGLGMSIVYGFVRSLGGFMTIESAPGEGTTVRVSVPCKVVESERCMSVADKDNISIGAYLHFEKFPNPRVREFYDSMVRNVVTGLKVTMHRVDNANSLRALIDNKKLTHLFVGPEEYLEAADLMEALAKQIIVTAVTNPDELHLPAGSLVRIMPKPFYCFPVVGVLNTKPSDVQKEESRLTFPGARVLVVDDEPMNLVVSTGMFKAYGMVVTTCESGQMAIDLCRENEYDIIFMDHMMPVMDGVEAMKRIRNDQTRNKRIVPIIAFTANAVSSAREMFRREGFDGFVSKPVDRVELERVMRHVLPASLVRTDGSGAPDISQNDIAPAQKPVTASLIDKLASLGVDTEKGLYYSQQDQSFYETLILQYLKESDEKKAIIKKALSSGDLAAYIIQVHSIKSTSKMIGAMDLSESARLLEEAGKSGDTAYIVANHMAMMTVYDRLLDAIRETAPSGNDNNVDETAGSDDDDEVLEFDAVGDEEGGVV
ncbi:MAG: response regulator [Lachnospiraceae bacterium]|nr:response regulator [Lachnospiraceae bacterium]